MNALLAAHLTLRDRLRREWYVTKVDFLAQDVPSGFRKELRRDLRADLGAAAADVGMPQAVRDLGPASALVHQFKQAEGRKLPHLWTGVLAFAIVLSAGAGMMLATLNGLIEAATQLRGGRTVTVQTTWLWTTATVTQGDHRMAAEVTGSGITLAVILVVTLLAARAWRYRPAWLQRRHARRATSAPIPGG